MNDKRKQLSVLIMSAALLLVAIIGATYAFFSATAQITEQSLSVTAATPTGLVYEDSGMLTLNNAIPGDRTSVTTFTVQNPSASSMNQIYSLSLHIDQNGFSSATNPGQIIMHVGHGNCSIDETSNEPLTCDSISEIDLSDGTTNMAAGTDVDIYEALVIPGETQTYYLYLEFVDIGLSQDENKNVPFVAHIELKNSMLIKDNALPYNDLSLNNKIKDKIINTPSYITLNSLNLSLKSGTPDFTKTAPLGTFYEGEFGEEIEAQFEEWSYFEYGAAYTFDSSSGIYRITNNQFGRLPDIYSDLVGKYITSVDEFMMMEEYSDTIYYITAATEDSITYRAKSSTVTYSTNENGIFSTEDDYGTSYYFRGNVANNYVKFGKNSSNQDMYWRVVRINGDGSLRMIYDGTQAYSNDTSSVDRFAKTNIKWNTKQKDAKFVGLMYGGSNSDSSNSTYYQPDMTAVNYANSNNAVYNETSSNVKLELEDWYENNILNTGYSNYLSDEVFCNDRSKSSDELGYALNRTGYNSYIRNIRNSIPTLVCPQKNDAFTVGYANNVGQDDITGYGNGYLKYPIGLISADEEAFAGNNYVDSYSYKNTKNYLYKGSVYYWTLSPLSYDTSTQTAGIISMTDSGMISGSSTACSNGLAPVINLSPETARSLIGNGTIGNEFRLN